uniref:Uncharacterized protein n=1 Tax=Utricularia reniformis TaxID=192314 RepID=A0A1Y0B2Z6_9LAMI|nr:hypothetical protein AEK19_MT1618 [Utricularia reniformis]ART31802.1 hypothetical protein AEK19_MT1618 [Utricularia reniformis]
MGKQIPPHYRYPRRGQISVSTIALLYSASPPYIPFYHSLNTCRNKDINHTIWLSELSNIYFVWNPIGTLQLMS